MACSDWNHAFAYCAGLVVVTLAANLLHAAEPVRLTHDGRMKFSATFAKQGTEIVYVDFEKPELFRLQRLNLETGQIEPLHPKSAVCEFEPTYSADGRYFAYVRLQGVLSVFVVIHNVEAKTDSEVSPGPGFAGLRTPAIAPDGSRVVFSFAEKSRQQLYSVDSKGGDRKQITDTAGVNIAPCYSPDGKQIAFSSTREGNYEIHVMDADGSNVRRLTENPFQDLRPAFSPDGRRIAFTSHRDGNAEIYLMNADGSNPRRLTNHPDRDDYPAWHPDGRRLLFVSERGGEHDLYLLDVDEAK